MKLWVCLSFLACIPSVLAQPVSTEFTYQGQLEHSGSPAEGSFDFRFELFNGAAASVSAQIELENISVSKGQFSVLLDFGISPFTGQELFLEIGVREAGARGAYTTLTPRQNLTATPYALFADTVSEGSITASNILDGSVDSAEIADFGVMTIDIANNAVTQAKLAGSSVGAGQIIDAEVQKRVTGSCPPLSFITAINSDGTVTCGSTVGTFRVEKQTIPDGVPGTFIFEGDVNGGVDDGGILSAFGLPGEYTAIENTASATFWGWELTDITCDDNNSFGDVPSATATFNVDLSEVVTCTFTNTRQGTITSVYPLSTQSGGAGEHSSLAIGADGFPVISMRDQSAEHSATDLAIVKCNDVGCLGGDDSAEQFDTNSFIGGTSLAIGTDNHPVISYRAGAAASDPLKVLKCNDPACSGGGEIITVLDDSMGGVGNHSAIAIGADGNPVIAYDGASGAVLHVAKCNDPACIDDDETLSTLNMPGDGGSFVSIAIGTDTFPIISFTDDSGIFVAKCNDFACTGANETITMLDGSSNRSSIAIGSDGNPVVAFFDPPGLSIAVCNDNACTGGDETITTVDNLGAADYPSVAIGSDNNPVVSYIQVFTPDFHLLRIAKCNDPLCTGGDETITLINPVGNVAEIYGSSLKIGSDGSPVISAQVCPNGTNCTLNVIHCSEPDCSR